MRIRSPIAPTPSNARRKRVGLAVVLVALSAACRDPAGPGHEPDQLLFVSDRAGVVSGGTRLADLYRMHEDGTGVENVTRDPSDYSSLEVTPDGRTVTFAASRPYGSSWTSTTNCPRRIWRMRTDGSPPTAISSGACSDRPRLSPDGVRIAYVYGGTTIRVAMLAGTGEWTVTNQLPPVEPSSCGTTPIVTLSATGWVSLERLSFFRHICGTGSTYYTVRFDGTELRTVGDIEPRSGFVSRDGGRFAYGVGSDVWVRNADGSGARMIAAAAQLRVTASSPWSPDGKTLLVSTAAGHRAVRTDDGSMREPAAPAGSGFSDWSRAGDQIAWAVFNGTVSDIHVTGVDGVARNVTNSASRNEGAVWVVNDRPR